MPKGIYERTPENTRKPREYPPEIVELARRMYVDEGMTVAEMRAAFPKGYRVQTILERYLPERRSCAKRDQAGQRNHMWRGNDATYGAIHLRMGKAADHACVDCGARAADWSYVGGCANEQGGVDSPPFCAHPEHYEPRCKRCHHHYDGRGHRANGQLKSRAEVSRNV